MNELAITPKSLAIALKHCIKHDVIPFVTSAPGAGKSSIVLQSAKQLAKEQGLNFYRFDGNSLQTEEQAQHGYGFIDLRANMLTTMDLYGLPTFTEDKQAYMFARPDMIPERGQGIIFVDELPQASQSTMGGFSEAFLEHRIGKHVIPKGWKFVVAGNRQKDRADAHKIPTHIKDRMNELPLEFSIGDWVEWAMDAELHPAAIAFAKYRPNLLDSFDPRLDTNCTPRAIEKAAAHIDAPVEIRFPLLVGALGEGPASEMEAMIRTFKELPDPDYILENPGKAPVSEKLDVLYAVTTMLSMHASGDNFEDLMKYIKRISAIEFQAAFVRSSILRDPSIVQTKALLEWAKQHKELLVG